MRILYDGLVYKLQTVGGISRYFSNLINRLPKTCVPILTAYASREIAYPTHPNLKKRSYLGAGLPPKRLSERLGKYYFRAVTAASKFDLLHPTYYWLHTEQEIGSYQCPLIVTFYDMIHELFANRMDPKGQLAQVKSRAAQAADIIICISENTKKDVIARYSLPESKVKVVYLAADINEKMSYGIEPIPKRPYFLYVGSRNPNYKNFETLLAAFAKVISVQPDAMLCVVGSPFKAKEQAMINDLGLAEHVVIYSDVNDHYLAKLYRCSIAFVYPSLYEGFGIPLIEAMACGTPVVASNSSCFPEIVGDSGLIFDPKATLDLTDILLSLLDSPMERDRWISKGHQRSKLFSWDKTAEQTLEVYRSAV